jgi:hypothetical protein
MSWLKQQKKKFDERDAEIEEERKKEKTNSIARQVAAISELKSFVNNNLKELVGKKTKDGNKISIKWDENLVTLMAGKEPLMELYFTSREEEDTDRDGYSCGNGKYYTSKQVKYHREWPCKGYAMCKGGSYSGMESFNEDRVAEYLLKFINV